MQQVNDFQQIAREFRERVFAMVWCNGATVDAEGRPRSRVIHPIWDGQAAYLTTDPKTAKVKQLKASPFISLAYIADPFKPVYVECRVIWQNDLPTRQLVWDLFKNIPEPMGGDLKNVWGHVDNPGYTVLRLEPWRIELYDLLNQPNRKLWTAG